MEAIAKSRSIHSNELTKLFFILLLVLVIVGCRVGPAYERPVVDTPTEYRGKMAPEISPSTDNSSIADEQWMAIFEDAILQRLELLTTDTDLYDARLRLA